MDTLTITIRIGDFELSGLPDLKKALEKLIEKYPDTQIMIAIQSPFPQTQFPSIKR